MRLEDSIKARHSVRKYEEKVVSKDAISKLKKTLDEAKALDPNVKCRVEIISSPEKVKEMKIGFLGGKVKINAPCCLVAITEKAAGGIENVAFIQEQAVLKLTEMGIGTCWLGTFDRECVRKGCALKSNEVVTNVIAFGYLQKSFYNKGLRKILGTTKRKAVEDITYYKKWNAASSSFLQSNSGLKNALYLSTLAPSSDNVQPVRVILEDNVIHVFSVDNKKNDYYKTDAGIFLSHLYLVLSEAESNVVLERKSISPTNMEVPNDVKYIASCGWGKDK